MSSRRVVTGLVVAVVVAITVVLLSGGSDAYTFKAELPNAGGVKPHSSVKIAGVPGGTVEKLEITPRDTALVTMKLDRAAGRVGRGATVQIRPTDLLGERYVALDAGDQARPEPDGYTIPISRTALPVELDDVLNAFDGDTRERIKIIVNEFGVALGSRGKDLARLLDAMPPSLDDARKLVEEVTDESGSLKALLERGDRVTASIDPRKDQLARLVVQADATLRELSERREKLGRTLDSAPAGLERLDQGLRSLRRLSADLRPASVDIADTAAPLKETLDALPGFEDAARDSLKAAHQAAPALTKLGNEATGPLRALTPTLGNVTRLSKDLAPTLDQLDDRGAEDVLWFAQNWSLGLKGRDGIGHFIGAFPSVNIATLRGVLASLFGGAGTPYDQDASLTSDDALAGRSRRVARTPRPPAEPPATRPPDPATGSTPAPTTAETVPSTPAPSGRGLLGGLLDGVSELLGSGTGTHGKPGPSPKGEGLPGLLDTLLAP